MFMGLNFLLDIPPIKSEEQNNECGVMFESDEHSLQLI